MQHDDDDIARIREQFSDVPLFDRTVALALAAVEHDPRTPAAIIFLLAVVKVLTRHLAENERTRIAWHLSEIVSEIETRWQ